MAWLFPNSWVSGNVPTASDFNNIAHDIRFWGGNVDAGANTLTNCAAVAGPGGTGNLSLNPSGGNIGIGTASPSAVLDVQLGSNAYNYAYFRAASGHNALLAIGGGGGPYTELQNVSTSGDFSLNAQGVAGGILYTFASGAVANTLVLKAGNVGIGTTSPTVSGTGKLHATGDRNRIFDASHTPSNSADTGNDGEICGDSSYVYIHTGGSWRRAALSTF